MIETIESLLQQYKSSLTEREKADLEARMWDLTSADMRQLTERKMWLKKMLGGSGWEYEQRSILLNAGSRAEDFWARIEAGQMMTSTAVRLYRQARKVVTKQLPIGAAIVHVLTEYDGMRVVKLKSGGTVRARVSGRLPTLKNARVTKSETKTFRGKLRKMLSDFICQEMEDTEASEAEKEIEWRRFEVEVNAVIDETRSRMRRLVQSRTKQVVVTRRILLDACKTLCLDPPLPGGRIDMVTAKSKKKQLCRAYHPDANGGSEAARAHFDAVLKAFEVVETYAAQMEPKRGPSKPKNIIDSTVN